MSVRVPILRPFVAADAIALIQKTLESGWIGEGEQVVAFERLVSDYIGNPRFAALNCCTSALYLSLHLAGIGQGDEVITTPMTSVATNLPILHRGATVVWADISNDGTISPRSIRKRITSASRAIVAVHFGGYPCEMKPIQEIAKENGLIVIEDAAHALGSSYQGTRIGSHSDFVCFSFQAVKMITTADGGGIAFRSEEYFQRARKLRWFGVDREDAHRFEKDISEAGFRLTMNDVAAALGNRNMRHIDRLLERRREIAAAYASGLGSVSGLTVCHPHDEDRVSSYWLFPVLVDKKAEFVSMLADAGIEASPVHWRNDNYTIFNRFCPDRLEGVDLWDEHMVCLPIGHWLDDDDVGHVIETIRNGHY